MDTEDIWRSIREIRIGMSAEIEKLKARIAELEKRLEASNKERESMPEFNLYIWTNKSTGCRGYAAGYTLEEAIQDAVKRDQQCAEDITLTLPEDEKREPAEIYQTVLGK